MSSKVPMQMRPGTGPHQLHRKKAEKIKDIKGTMKRLLGYLIEKKFNIFIVFVLCFITTLISILGTRLNGIPSLVNEMSAGVVIFIFNIVLVKIGGVEAVSAYSIISNVALICTAIFNGISQGIQPIISMNYGAKKIDRVISAFKLARKISFVSGVVFFIIGVSNPEFIARIFSSNIEGILDITCSGIRIYFLSFIVMGVNIVSIGFMQSIERSKVSTIISLIRGFILISIVIVIMSYIMGLTGAWLTVPIVESITLIYTIIIIKRDKSIYLQK